MEKIFVSLLLFVCSCSAIRNIDKQDPLSVAFLQKHLNVIASADMEGRNTPSPGLEKAASYIERNFKLWGLATAPGASGYRQYYPLQKDSLLGASLSIGNSVGIDAKDFDIPLAGNHSFNIVANSIVFAGYGIEDAGYSDYKNINPKGKILVIALGEPYVGETYLATNSKVANWTRRGLQKKLALAMQKGALGVIVLNPAQQNFTPGYLTNSRSNVYTYPNVADSSIPNLVLTKTFALQTLGESINQFYLKANTTQPFAAEDYKEMATQVKMQLKKSSLKVTVSNVLGIVEGSDKKDEAIFVTAHYDHLGVQDGKIYFGADDDGSGTVAVMAMAKHFASEKIKGNAPHRTMVFMLVSGEEKGLWGSRFYSDNPLFSLAKTTVNLNIDMIGRIDTERKLADTLNYVYVVGHDKLSTDLKKLLDENNKAHQITMDYKFDDPADVNKIYFRSDHYNFARKGVPVLFFYDGMLKADYHKPTDTVDKINWSLYLKRLKFINTLAKTIADKEQMLVRDIPLENLPK